MILGFIHVRQGVTSLLALMMAISLIFGAPKLAVAQSDLSPIQSDGALVRPNDLRALSNAIAADYYQRNNIDRLWTDPNDIAQAFKLIAGAYEDGLDPEDFDYSRLQSMRMVGDLDKMDRELTAAIYRLGYALHFGKVDPEKLDSDWNLRRFVNQDQRLQLQQILARDGLTAAFDLLRPQSVYYARLRKVLAQVRSLTRFDEFPPVPQGKSMDVGDSGPRVAALSARLAAGGFDVNPKSRRYTARTVAAVEAFQKRFSLEADGIAGPKTLAALNVPLQERIDQIRVNMERARWVGDLSDSRAVLVNIAGFEAAVFDHGKISWKTRVVVGADYSKTPVFTDKIRYLEFNPTWTVPQSIIRKELGAKIIADPSYLARNGYYLVDAKRNRIDISAVDWRSVTPQNFPYWVVQGPGTQNALGRVKFMFPNSHAVYLHDTPARHLFALGRRNFSHGCIRVEHPLHLAEILLSPQSVSPEEIDQILESGKTTRIDLAEPVNVALLYFTADTLEEHIRFHPDIYDRDPAVLAALDKPL